MEHTHDMHGSHTGHEPAVSPEASEPGYPEHPEQRAAHVRGRHEEHSGHDKHAGHSVAMFRRKFWLSLILTIPTLVWGHMLQRAFGYTAPHFSRLHVDSATLRYGRLSLWWLGIHPGGK